MTKYIKKLKRVDAVQWFKEGDHEAVKMIGHHMDIKCPYGRGDCKVPLEAHGVLINGHYYLGGEVCPGDFIITDWKGYHTSMHPLEFDHYYEMVKEGEE